ncbi:DUF4214 domain-containing protein [Massilia sp. erpn]|uniref:DUF4214 domain-containing protein n=1 Tax=Massilia sp. erpn TaxID=2738142 RepID=UPI0021083975|nr:DUF4214 domain-containing protein [Massilia sp. erpn]UTY56078.1 DUF4214 domain-containing protein [Massilia sp. erpn]
MSLVSSKIYLSAFSATPFNQLSYNSCVSNAVAQAIRLEARAYHKDPGELARNQIYYDYRVKYANPGIDNGAVLDKMLDVAMTDGVATQASAAPYEGSLYQAPTAAARASASSEKLTGYSDFAAWLQYRGGDRSQPIDYDTTNFRLNIDQQQASINSAIDTQLMHGKAVLMSGTVPQWLGSLPSVSLNAQGIFHDNKTSLGNHAFLIVGRDDGLNGGSYIVENSWGPNFGDRGYYAMSYKFLNEGFIVHDAAVTNGFKGVDTAWTKERGDMSMLYVNLLGRAADHGGMEFWATAEKNGVTVSHIANQMASSAEGTQKYGGLSNIDYVNKLYINMTGHGLDSGSLSGWASMLDQGAQRGDVGLKIMNSILASTGADHDTLLNRTTVSETYAVTYQLDGPLNAAAQAIASVNANADSVQVALTGVQHDLGWMAGNVTTYGFYA